MPLFARMESFYREDLLLQLWAQMRPQIYGAFVPIATYGEGNTELYVITMGTVVLQQGNSLLTTLKTGECFGQDWLLGYDRRPTRETEPEVWAPVKRRASIIRILAGGGAAEGAQNGTLEGTDKAGQSDSRHSRRESEVRMASSFRYMAAGDVHCMVLSKEAFDSTVAENHPSIGVFFEGERARLEEEQEEEEGDEKEEEDVSERHMSALVKARWAMIVRRVYSKFLGRDSSAIWLRASRKITAAVGALSHSGRRADAILRTPSAEEHVSRLASFGNAGGTTQSGRGVQGAEAVAASKVRRFTRSRSDSDLGSRSEEGAAGGLEELPHNDGGSCHPARVCQHLPSLEITTHESGCGVRLETGGEEDGHVAPATPPVCAMPPSAEVPGIELGILGNGERPEEKKRGRRGGEEDGEGRKPGSSGGEGRGVAGEVAEVRRLMEQEQQRQRAWQQQMVQVRSKSNSTRKRTLTLLDLSRRAHHI